VTDLAGRTTLGTLAVLCERSRMLIANDTGVAHLAETLGVPSVVLFHPSQVDRWAPADRRRHQVISPASDATPDAVIRAAIELMAATDPAILHRAARPAPGGPTLKDGACAGLGSSPGTCTAATSTTCRTCRTTFTCR
jgi:ADP-heptose:LPS heptosyltransferase